MTTPVRVGIRCDAGPATGVGHLMRCVALAEELVRRGAVVTFLSDLGGLAWANQQLADRRLPREAAPPTPGSLVEAARRLRLDAVVLDSYDLAPPFADAVRADGRLAVAIVDGDLRGQHADVYLDQNLDAERRPVAVPPGAVRLAGLRYALLRDAVRQRRPQRPRRSVGRRVPRVVCFFGGTDPFRAATSVVPLLVATGAPGDVVVVAADDGIRTGLSAISPAPGQTITVISPTDDLPAVLADADLAVSASGTSTWELLCLGLPAALVWVVDNQREGYRRTVLGGLACGLGRLGDLTGDTAAIDGATTALRSLLTDPSVRARLATRAWAAVDGRGVQRVADEVLRQLGRRPGAVRRAG